MRLTLRTMLAYLDDVLEPADAAELRAKIQESEMATKLVHTIRNSVMRMRLGAPKLEVGKPEGRAFALDPNTVANYLDSTLAPEQVPDFEKVCLESEVHLAEVAACHQVLTLVLGEPAEIPAMLRERMYRLPNEPAQTRQERDALAAGAARLDSPSSHNGPHASEIAAATTASPVAQSAPAAVAALKTAKPLGETAPAMTPPPAAVSSTSAESADGATAGTHVASNDAVAPRRERVKPQVPDYMKTKTQLRVWPLAIAFLLAFVLVGAVIMAVGKDRFLAMLGMGDTIQVAQNDATDAQRPAAPAPIPDKSSDNAGAAEAPVDPTPGGAADDDSFRPADPVPVPGPVEPPSDDAEPQGDIEEPLPPILPPNDDDGFVPPPVDVGGADDDDPRIARVDPPPVIVDPAGPAQPPAVPAGDLGRFVSDEQMLARFDPHQNVWFRLPARTPLTVGDRLVSFPGYRPQLVLGHGVQIGLVDGASIQLEQPDPQGMPRIGLLYGRGALLTVGKAGTRVELRFGERSGVLTFGDAESAVAWDVHSLFPPGENPEKAEHLLRFRLFCTNGSVTWQESDAPQARLLAGQAVETVGQAPGSLWDQAPLPAWAASGGQSDINRLAAQTLSELVDTERPLSVILQECTEHRRAEVRALAARGLIYLDEYAETIEALNDDSQRSFWSGYFETLRDNAARGPQAAAQFRAALERARGPQAAELYRLLWGYSPANLRAGGAEKLVEQLNSESLDVRVLAFENLRNITGMTLLYRPEQPETRRRPAIQPWRERLAKGEIAYKSAPAEFRYFEAEHEEPAAEGQPANE